MTGEIYENKILNERFPLGIRRYATGLRYAELLDSEVKKYKRSRCYLMMASLVLIGFSLGSVYDHPWNSTYQVICFGLATWVIILLINIRRTNLSVEAKLTPQRSREYEKLSLTPVLDQLDLSNGGLPAWVPSKHFTHLEYEKQMISRQVLCGTLSKTDISSSAMNRLDSLRWQTKLANQAAISSLHEVANLPFKKSVFDAILRRSETALSPLSQRQQSICAAKSACYDDHVAKTPPLLRARVIWQAVKERLGKCLTSEGQIEEAILKNTHCSLDTILKKYDRLE